jgi:hypothetical protein
MENLLEGKEWVAHPTTLSYFSAVSCSNVGEEMHAMYGI